MHGEVFGGEALDIGGPLRLGAAGLDELNDGSVGTGEGILLGVEAIEAEGKAGEIEDDAGRMRGEGGLHEAQAGAFLQRRDDERERGEVLRFEFGDEGVDGGGAGAFEGGAVEEQWNDRSIQCVGEVESEAGSGVIVAEAGEGARAQVSRS